MIEILGLTKRYGDRIAVDDLSFAVRPGQVTGFLGPNGAGKSTTMRAIVGLDRPTNGGVTINGRRYAQRTAPLREVGALLEARAVHPGRTAYAHLLFLARSNGIPARRVGEVLELAGIEEVARKRAGSFSLGMGQRLGIAAALLGDPAVLLFDEPGNGLDPEGILWVRRLLKQLASEGRTVLVSSHLMAEMALTADHLVVIGAGRLIADTTVEEVVQAASSGEVLVRAEEPGRLARALRENNANVVLESDGGLTVRGLNPTEIGRIARDARLVLAELTPRLASLEEAFMQMTHDSVEYNATLPASHSLTTPAAR